MSAVLKQPLLTATATDDQEVVFLSHSRKTTMQRCGRLYRYTYVDRLASSLGSATLGYGKAVHSAASAALTSQSLIGVVGDPIAIFDLEWQRFVRENAVKYSAHFDEDSMAATGRLVLERFKDDWEQRGWEPVVDTEGMPVIERELKVRLPGNIVFTIIVDALVRTREGQVLVLDFKTPAKVSNVEFTDLSDQLLGYQVVCDAHKALLGINQVDGGVFYEMTKVTIPKTSRGAGPRIHISDIVPRRSQEDINDWIRETQFVAQDIRQQRFTRRTLDAWNTSCALCDFNKICRGLPDPDVYVRKNRNFKGSNAASSSNC